MTGPIEATGPIEVTGNVIATLIEEARRAGPVECCGLLLGPGGEQGSAARIIRVQTAANVHPEPDRHFEIDPAALIGAYRAAREGGAALIGFYHSHPNGHPRPSAMDCEHAGGDGRIWAIVAAGDVHFWRDMPQGFTQVSVSVVSA